MSQLMDVAMLHRMTAFEIRHIHLHQHLMALNQHRLSFIWTARMTMKWCRLSCVTEHPRPCKQISQALAIHILKEDLLEN